MKVNGKDYPIYYGKESKCLKPPIRICAKLGVNPEIWDLIEKHWGVSKQLWQYGMAISWKNILG